MTETLSTPVERLTDWLAAAETLAKGGIDRNAFHVAWTGGDVDHPKILSLDDVAAVLAELAMARHMLNEAIECMDAEGMDTEFWTSRL
jgi:hypothetical protein